MSVSQPWYLSLPERAMAFSSALAVEQWVRCIDGTAEQEQECADAGPTCTSIYSDSSMKTLHDDSDLAEHLETIVTGCTAWKNGGHYDLDAITGGTR